MCKEGNEICQENMVSWLHWFLFLTSVNKKKGSEHPLSVAGSAADNSHLLLLRVLLCQLCFTLVKDAVSGRSLRNERQCLNCWRYMYPELSLFAQRFWGSLLRERNLSGHAHNCLDFIFCCVFLSVERLPGFLFLD